MSRFHEWRTSATRLMWHRIPPPDRAPGPSRAVWWSRNLSCLAASCSSFRPPFASWADLIVFGDAVGEQRQAIERAYEEARGGGWEQMLSAWRLTPHLAQECSRYQRASSGWTFLHQAAYFGHEAACRELIRAGAAVDALSHERQSAADVAEERKYPALAALLRRASLGAESPWSAPRDPSLLPSSNVWREAAERRASAAMRVAYAGGVVKIPAGSRYFVDSFERALVGWHGTYDPPCGMDTEPLIRP